ncbi:MAG: DsbE family thiol:disulfide interchange protein [Pseudomonadota bacterium]
MKIKRWPLAACFSLLALIALIALLALGLQLNPRELPSPLVGKTAPDFSLMRLDKPAQSFSPKEMLGQVWLLNVWASWCTSCRQEHPILLELAARQTLPIVGLNYKEIRGDASIDQDKIEPSQELLVAQRRAQDWLSSQGNPYQLTVLDLNGRVGIDYGVYGVPESYLIDQNGLIRFKHIGPLTNEVISQSILPLLAQLKR